MSEQLVVEVNVKINHAFPLSVKLSHKDSRMIYVQTSNKHKRNLNLKNVVQRKEGQVESLIKELRQVNYIAKHEVFLPIGS